MEDEVVYSSVAFQRFDESNPKVAMEPVEEVVYSEVKKSGGAPAQSSPDTSGESTDALVEATAASRAASYRKAITCLGLLCVLLLAGVVGMSVLNIIHSSQNNDVLALYKNASMAFKKVQAEKAALEKEKDELAVQSNQLNNTLRTITRMKNFPVQQYCQATNGEIHCEPCMKNWIQNGSSCYFFYYESWYWKNWKDSQQICNEMGGDLAIIDNREEQEFIMLHTPFYYDKYHGYWIGLSKKNNTWVWTNGNTLENGFWMKPQIYVGETCVMTQSTRNAQESWQASSCSMLNKYVCEMSVLEWPSKI